MKTDWRPIVASDYCAYGTLLDMAFGLTDPLHFLDDFPVWNPSLPNQTGRFQLGAWVDEKIIATASLRVANYKTQNGKSIKLGIVGAVATLPGEQGKGFASYLLDLLLKEGRSQSVDGFVLWGAESPLYKKRGFEFSGKQLRSKFDKLEIHGELAEGFEVRNGWDAAIALHLLKRNAGLQYTDADILWLSKHSGVEWRTLWLEEKCIAYCGWNRGIDLPGIIHELGGTAIGMRTLLDFVRKKYVFLEFLHHPDLASAGIFSPVPQEFLAQFLFEGGCTESQSLIDSLWFSGMDSC